ncbi:MAG: DUF1501 domain-containing protein [Verrucomicrobiota bacterium]|nr:DUF1501 domain-containing protein [Verrucomicrobiota bacterium]
MRQLANGLAAFRCDLGSAMRVSTVVVMSEFGRRVSENSALGTDHGRERALDYPCFWAGGNGQFRSHDPTPCHHKTSRSRD